MSIKPRLLLIGATGETGNAILDGLREDGGFDLTIASRSPSLAANLAVDGIHVRQIPPQASAEDLALLLADIDICVSAVGPLAQLDQFKWVDAAKRAGVQRFVPCGFTTICPRGGVMRIRDEKEEVHDHIFKSHLPFTIVDVGYWYQLSFPTVPSGRLDRVALRPNTELYGDGAAMNLLTDKRDIGRFVARIVKDPQTLNKRVVAYGCELSQTQIFDMTAKLSGEPLLPRHVSEKEMLNQMEQVMASSKKAGLDDLPTSHAVFSIQYVNSKYFRRDNTLRVAKYLGYLDARELYPDFEPITFEDFLQELLEGNGVRPYERKLQSKQQ